MWSPGASSNERVSRPSRKSPGSSRLTRSWVQTKKAVEPGRYSQRSTTLTLSDLKLKSGSFRANGAAAPAAMPAGHVSVPAAMAPPVAARPAAGSHAPIPLPLAVPSSMGSARGMMSGSDSGVGESKWSQRWSRRWPYAVGGVALIAIGISVGVLVIQPDDGSKPRTRTNRSASPHRVPDDMPQPAPTMPVPDPDLSGPQSGLPPGFPPPTPGAPPMPGNVPNAGMFAVAMTNAVCAKLTDCGLMDDFSGQLCRELAAQAEDPEAEARVQRGECRYDSARATTCLKTISSLACDAQTPDVLTLMTQAGSLMECTSVYVCM